MSVSQTIILGRLGSTPELRYTASKKAVANFSVAVDQGYGDKKVTEWFRVVVWGAQAEACSKYLSKGREVYIESQKRSRSYKNKSGVDVEVTEFHATKVVFIGGDISGQSTAEAKNETQPLTPSFTEDDIPF